MEKSYKIGKRLIGLSNVEIALSLDKFSCLEANIYLRRSIGYHLVQSFIPTGGNFILFKLNNFWIFAL